MLSADTDNANSLAAQVTAYVKTHGIPWAQFSRHSRVSLSVLVRLRKGEPVTPYIQDRLTNALATRPDTTRPVRRNRSADELIDRLKSALQRREVTQNQLALELGIGSAYLSRILTGQTRPYPKNCAKLNQKLDAYLSESEPHLQHLLVRLPSEGTLNADKLDRLKELI